MPQMAPISWIFMLIFFIMNLYMFSTLNYLSFNTQYTHSYINLNKNKFLYNWKW